MKLFFTKIAFQKDSIKVLKKFTSLDDFFNVFKAMEHNIYKLCGTFDLAELARL